MKRTRVRLLSVIVTVIFVLQMLPLNWVSAISPSDLTDTAYLVIHEPDYDPPERASSLEITQADGTPISPAADGSYNDIPAGAKIMLEYAFHLEDGDGTDLYDYTGDEYFTAELPEGLNFTDTSGTVDVVDSTGGYTYTLATWSISGNTLTVEFTNDSEDPSGYGGAANDAHLDKWGKIHIEGTFQSLDAGDGTSTEIRFGSEVIIINRQPLPMESTLAKSGRYDASDNTITWTVTVTPPAGAPDMAYDGYSLIDEFSSNQTYVADSFTVGGNPVPDTELDLSDITNQTITYTFPDTDPDTTGVQTVTYKTGPNNFSAEDGTPNYAEFTNTASLKRGTDNAADPVTDNVRLDWIEKTGSSAATTEDPTITKWTVTVTVPGETGKSISGAQIVDNLHPDLELFADGNHPVQIQFGSAAATDVTSGSGDGQYDYSSNTLTYRFPADSQPTAGTTATLTFYTRVKDSARDRYLDDNNAISFNNEAILTWDENTTGTEPSDTATVANGVGAGGLLSKSSEGGTPAYAYSISDPGTIHWTITVNRSRINIENAKILDAIPSGQILLIDSEHTFTVMKKGAPDTTVYSDDGTAVNPSLGTFAATSDGFSYEFPDEDPGDGLDDTIKSTYTVDYYTRIVDTVPGTPGDGSGLDTLYKNGNVSFGNGVTLTRNGSGGNVYTPGTKTYSSQMLDKSIVTEYNYNERTVQWKIVVNRNRLPLTDAVVTDTIPSGMTLFIDTEHPFTVTAADGGAVGTLSGANGDTSFTYTLPASTSDQYTITFWTLMDEAALKTQWSGTQPFTNNASLDAEEITISDSATAQIRNPVISKTYQYTPGSDHIDWSVIINPGQVLLTKGVVTDVLHPGLGLDPDSVKLYEVSINGSNGAIAGTVGEVPAENYVVTLPTTANGNTLTVELPESTSSAYRLEFTTNILVDNIDLTNRIDLSGSAGDPSGGSTSSQIVITNLYSGGGSGSNTLTVHKMDSDGNPLSGVVFRLLNVNRQPVTSSGNLITRTTNTSGDAVFNNLPSWVFYVEETEPAPGYLLPSDPIFGDGSRLNGTGTISVSNALALGTVSFDKTGAGGVPLSGGTFTLTGKDYKNDDVSMTATAVNGVVTFTGVPLGRTGEPYIITETASPDGHTTNPATLTATVEYDSEKTGVTVNVTPNTLVNTPLPGTVSFSKTGVGDTPLTGGAFTLTGTDYTGSVVSMTSSAVSGIVTFADVPIGSYTIAETDPPEGYLLPGSTDILTATVEYNPTSTGVVTTVREISAGTPIISEYINTPALGSISFTKTSSGGSPLTGGTFTLTGTDYAGNAVALTASSVAGTVTFTDVPLGNNYTIRETIPPSGYVKSNTELTASVSYNGDKTAVLTNVSPNTLSNVPKPDSGSGNVYGKIEITKTDEGGHKLAGATFALYGQSNGSLIATAVSDSQGVARFNNVPEGQYVIRETGVPAGYVLSTESINVSVTSTATRTFTMINRAEESLPGNIQIIKTDGAGNVLEGAEFTLYDASGTALKSVVTGPDGRAVFDRVPTGSYTVSETRAPAGYVAGTGSTASTVSSGQTVNLTFTNQKISTDTNQKISTESGSMRIKKVDKDSNPLSGAEFTLYNESGAAIRKVVSGADGFVLFAGLTPGKYSVRETAAPEGYELFTEPLTFDIRAGQTLSYTLRNNLLTDEPDILGWIDDTSVPGGTLPQAGGVPGTFYIAIAGLVLSSVGLLLAKPKKYRMKNRT